MFAQHHVEPGVCLTRTWLMVEIYQCIAFFCSESCVTGGGARVKLGSIAQKFDAATMARLVDGW